MGITHLLWIRSGFHIAEDLLTCFLRCRKFALIYSETVPLEHFPPAAVVVRLLVAAGAV
jgi:hypothetical protein